MSGHDAPEWSVTIDQNRWSRSARIPKIWQLAFYDPLTRLPNRRLLIDRLEHVQAISTRNKLHNALLFIDLDNFKTINDTLGHDKGDLLLQEVARRLVSCVRTADTVARLGGDEFVIMISELSENLEAAAVQVEQVGEKILMHLNQPYQLADHLYRSTSSIGVTLFSGRDESTDDLLKRADLAMYQAKSAGRNTLRFFEPDMQAAVSARAELEIDLRHGQQDAQFILYYQAQVDHSGRWTGAEALIRWQHPKRGLVSPAEFIPAAEENGLILTLGRWVLETACSQLVVWSLRPETSHLTLAVNVSMRQFRQPDFVKDVTELLELTGADPRMLKLELTESMLLVNVEDIIIKMSALIALGIRFSLDDFGTGYSSLSHLKRLPLDQLKIDQTFVRDVLTDPNDAAIVRTIVALAQSLGLSVIAEGVETASQMTFLSNNGCSAYQGYLFSRPLPLEQFEALHLKENHANAITDLSTPLIR
ncbi:EAL domain-containing protein, partial [Glaciimonas sp. CA11.2]|uniref:putative bifunctional diguanylate cyclase/phosphodiesterase n=1 Tax=Glaciimonas sp. CA11.2 TaxID=3048601 RepID=UPI002B224ED8